MSGESTTGDTSVKADAWTIKRLLDWTAEYFEKHDSDSPRLDAEILLAEALGCQRIELYTRFNEQPDPAQVLVFRGWVKRRAEGEPVAYLVGHREFYSLRLEVNSSVLIPRPETEHVVIAAIEAASQISGRPATIADAGTGSGCIVIALAKHIADAKLIATDISADALEVARRNADALGVADRIRFHQCNLLESVDGPLDIIVSNPPYIGTEEQGTVEEAVRQFEPAVALFSGTDGTEATRELVAHSRDRLSSGGHLIIETSPFIIDACCALIEADGAFSVKDRVRDLGGHDRVIVAEKC